MRTLTSGQINVVAARGRQPVPFGGALIVLRALVHIKINSANDGTKTAIAFCVQPITEPSSS